MGQRGAYRTDSGGGLGGVPCEAGSGVQGNAPVSHSLPSGPVDKRWGTHSEQGRL